MHSLISKSKSPLIQSAGRVGTPLVSDLLTEALHLADAGPSVGGTAAPILSPLRDLASPSGEEVSSATLPAVHRGSATFHFTAGPHPRIPVLP